MQRHLRLRNRADFQRLRVQGKLWRHQALMMSVAPNNLPHNRYGFIVSKRLGKAVTRNRLRRRLRACLRIRDVNILPGHDFVFITRQPCMTLQSKELCAVIDNLLQEANLWDKGS